MINDPMDIQIVPPGKPYPNPCPFCRSTNLLCIAMSEEEQLQLTIHCQTCKCVGPIGDPYENVESAEISAINEWNNRDQPRVVQVPESGRIEYKPSES